MMDNLPLYEAKITDMSEGVYAIALVDYPAVESNFVAFKSEKKPLMYSVQNEEQHVIFGVLMRADWPIYRIGNSGYEYYIFYSKETVKQMAQKMLRDGTQNCFNAMHNEMNPIYGVECFQVFLKDVEKGVNPAGFEDIEDGSLFGAFKVNNLETWEAIKDGTFKGFSIEGFFTVDEVEQVENKQSKNQKNSMSKLKNALRKLLAEFGEVETDKGILSYEGELAVGVEVTIDGEMAADGEYEAEDKVIVVADGKVAEIREKEAPAEATETPAEAQENEEVVPVEEKPVAEVVEDVVKEQTRDLEAEIDALKAEIELLKEQIAELVGKPVDPPVEEQFEAVKDKNEKKSKIEQRMAYLRK